MCQIRKGAGVERFRGELYAAGMKDNQNASQPVELFRSPLLLDRRHSCLLVVDVQEKLLPLVDRHPVVQWNIERLLIAAKHLQVPFAASEQYPTGLGPTVAGIRAHLDSVAEKRMFSCRECTTWAADWSRRGIRQIVVAGIETHVCVLQTALDLQSAGFDVFIPADAVGSRSAFDYAAALNRLGHAGVTISTTESTLFEWCETSAATEFKAISQLVKRTSPD